MKPTTTYIEEALAANGNVLSADAEISRLIGTFMFRTADWIRLVGGPWLDEPLMERMINSAVGRENAPGKMYKPWGHVPQWNDRKEMEESWWPWAAQFNALRTFAEEGIFNMPEAYDHELSPEPRDLDKIERLARMFPLEWVDYEEGVSAYHSVWLIYGKARARLRLDQGQDLAFYEVVLLSGMHSKSVRNATQHRFGDRRLRVSDDDQVRNTDAVTWLLERNTFVPTPGAAYDVREQTDFDPADIVFIPVSKDGRAFEPVTACDRGPWGPAYRVIADDSAKEDTYFETYFDALERIMRAKTGTWLFNDGAWAEPAGWKRASKREMRRQDKQMQEERIVVAKKEMDHAKELAILDPSLIDPSIFDTDAGG